MNNKIIAIDGPAGSGKSTIAKLLAQAFDFVYLDTGAMYRAITCLALQNNLTADSEELIDLTQKAEIKFNNQNVLLNNLDITTQIRTLEVSQYVSHIASNPKIREILVELQRQYAVNYSVILDGRDIGTVVFPNADLKLFLVATPEIRAQRRFAELKANAQNQDIQYDDVLNNIKERDQIDSTREASPLKQASDAQEIDTSELSIENIVNIITPLIQQL